MKYAILLALATTLLIGTSGLAVAGVYDFESFSTGQSINGQNGWTVEDSFGNSGELFDEEVVDDGTGNNVWRVSNSFTSTGYSNQTFSGASPQVAGETGAELYNDYGGDHTMPNSPPLSSATAASKYFYGAWDFKSATGSAQADLRMDISASASQSTLRQSFIRISDTGSGFDLTFFDTTGSSFNGPTTVASGLNYTDWNSVEMYIEFVDGIGPGAAGSEAGNDIVTILVNGSVVHTGSTWESFFYNNADAGITAPSTRAVDSLLFRNSGTAQLANDGDGFYFDNVEVSNGFFVIPEPATITLFGLAGVALLLRRRRRHRE